MREHAAAILPVPLAMLALVVVVPAVPTGGVALAVAVGLVWLWRRRPELDRSFERYHASPAQRSADLTLAVPRHLLRTVTGRGERPRALADLLAATILLGAVVAGPIATHELTAHGVNVGDAGVFALTILAWDILLEGILYAERHERYAEETPHRFPRVRVLVAIVLVLEVLAYVLLRVADLDADAGVARAILSAVALIGLADIVGLVSTTLMARHDGRPIL